MDPCPVPHSPPFGKRSSILPKGKCAAVVILVALAALAAGCAGTLPAAGPGTAPVPSTLPEIPAAPEIELVFFHPVPGCDSCERVGFLANETVTAYFSREVAAGNLTFRNVNLNLPENRGIADRYGAYSESLWLGKYNASGFHATEIGDIWYFAYNHDEFMRYLRGILERELAAP